MNPVPIVRTLLPCLAALALGCAGGGGSNDRAVLPQAPVSVLVGGSVTLGDHRQALYWKDGKAVYLENEAGVNSVVTALAVSGTDVYAVGGHSGHPEPGVLWTNGTLTEVPLPPSLPASSYPYTGILTGIAVVGADIHICGTVGTDATRNLAVHWKNGSGSALGGGSVFSTASGICVKGSNVFVAGWEGGARYWKNGVAFGLGSDTAAGGVAAVAVMDTGDVLAAGYTVTAAGAHVATLWRNGEPVALTDGVHPGVALALAVAGPDVYAAGYVQVGRTHVPVYWKNGTQTTLPVSQGLSAQACGIAPYGTDLYVIGNMDDTAVLWKNGSQIPLLDGANPTWATSICLMPR